MRRSQLACFAAVLLAAFVVPASATPITLFYGGDSDPNHANSDDALNSNVGGGGSSQVYQSFTVRNRTWDVTELFSNNTLVRPGVAANVEWEIREGLSPGNGGTLLYSGSNAPATVTATGRFSQEYTVAVDVSLTLAPGTYWFSVSPMTSSGASFESDSFGLNAVGSYTFGQQYFNSSAFGSNFVNANTEGPGLNNFSTGIIGTKAGVPVPEPSSLSLMLGGLAMLGVVFCLRRKKSLAA